MRKHGGFTLIELLAFIIITSILFSSLVIPFNKTLLNTPTIHNQLQAKYTATRCMEWFLGQKMINGFSSLSCGASKPSFCTAPSGYNISTSITCTTINSDSNYKIIAVNVTGKGNASLSLIVAS